MPLLFAVQISVYRSVVTEVTAPSDEGAVMPNGMTGGENSRDTSSFSPSAPSGHLPHQREAIALTNAAPNSNFA